MSFQQHLSKLPKILSKDYPIFKHLVLSELREARFGETVAASRGFKYKYGAYDNIAILVKESGEISIKVTNGYTPSPADFLKPGGVKKAYDVLNFKSYKEYFKLSPSFPYKEAVDQVLSTMSEAEIYLSRPYYKGKKGYEVPKSYEFSYMSRTEYSDPLTDNVKVIHHKNINGEYVTPIMSLVVK